MVRGGGSIQLFGQTKQLALIAARRRTMSRRVASATPKMRSRSGPGIHTTIRLYVTWVTRFVGR